MSRQIFVVGFECCAVQNCYCGARTALFIHLQCGSSLSSRFIVDAQKYYPDMSISSDVTTRLDNSVLAGLREEELFTMLKVFHTNIFGAPKATEP